jgi:hypothetical protein
LRQREPRHDSAHQAGEAAVEPTHRSRIGARGGDDRRVEAAGDGGTLMSTSLDSSPAPLARRDGDHDARRHAARAGASPTSSRADAGRRARAQ